MAIIGEKRRGEKMKWLDCIQHFCLVVSCLIKTLSLPQAEERELNLIYHDFSISQPFRVLGSRHYEVKLSQVVLGLCAGRHIL